MSDDPTPLPRSPIDRAFLTNDAEVTEVVLVRHGQQRHPDLGAGATVGEWRDPPLSDLGRRQAVATATHLAHERLDAVYASTLERARDTGVAVAEAHGLEAAIVPELEEIHMFGDLPADRTPMDVVAPLLLSGARERFARRRQWDVYPHTETSIEFRRRVGGAIEGIIATHPGQTVAVACHGGVINAYLADVLGLDEDMFFRPAHASVHRLLAKEDRRVVLCLNEIRHLVRPDDLLTF